MTYIIFLIVAAAVVVLGTVYVRKQRKKLRDERERKLRIAAGQVVEPEVPKRRLFQLLGRQPVLPAVPPEIEEQVRTKVPPAVDEVLLHWHAQRDALDKAKAADDAAFYAEIAAAVGEPYDKPSTDPANVFKQLAANQLKERRAQREALHQRERFSQELRALARAGHALQEVVPPQFFAALLPADLQAIVTAAAQVLSECQKPKDQPRDLRFARPDSEPTEVAPETEHLLEEVTQAALDLSGALLTLRQAYLGASARCNQLDQCRRLPTLDEPEKPNDADVQAWIASAIDWSQQSFEREQPFSQALEDLRSALDNAERCSKALLARLDPLRALAAAHLSGQRLPAPVEALPAPPSPPPLGETGQSESAPKGKAGSGQYVWQPAPEPQVTREKHLVALLNDGQCAQFHAAERLHQFFGTARNTYLPHLDSWSKIRLHGFRQEEGKTAEPADTKIAQVRAAMRKLGFALAQCSTAQQKLAAEQARAAETVELDQPSLDESNVEMYVRSHRRWCKDQAANAAATEARSKRIDSYTQQLQERKSQVANAAAALSALIKPPAASLREAVILRAAQAMAAQAVAK